ncbi:GtrA family protein [Actinomadura parmotrematis]|uniref:GtrA family protein n=1 Tax=Actinomadura parmotrematis TaxID=2864039 RepID=A0ABS7FW83_9ACTN|nr:GtrA family protein [Actinomadura parmotrematis]MBW8484679.1 GtrA family protein [Actinomadura parmotrematis]
MSLLTGLHRRFAHLVHELLKFGSVGALAFAITLATGNALHVGLGLGELTATGIATVVATTFAYLANRYWTFRHRDQSGLGREYVLFFALNGVGLVITWLFQGVTKFVLDLHGPLAYNASLIIGTAAATLFRYWSYKRWVFLPPDAPPVAPASGLPEAPEAPEAPEPPRPGHPGGRRLGSPPRPEGYAEFTGTR